MAAYDWDRQLPHGRGIERCLDRALGKHYIVRPVAKELQEFGIDRVIVNKKTRVSYSAEYRADFMMAAMGQAFIEAETRTDPPRTAWIKSMMAQVLVFADVATGVAYFLNAADIKRLDLTQFPSAEIRKDNQRVSGHTIPIAKLAEMAFGRMKFDPQEAFSGEPP